MNSIDKYKDQNITFEDINNTYIEDTVSIADGCFIGAGTRLKGNTILQENVTIEGDAVIIDSEIKSGTIIHYFSIIEKSKIGLKCKIGPFARIRPETNLAEEVHVGNFVEIKKSNLETGVKANHLTYIGDAYIGEKTNIGAGTITCNYDGVFKHPTKIGKNAFIGSNAALVAPIEIGDNTLIGAGSVITKNVENDALALTRAEQKNIEGLAKRKMDTLKAKKHCKD